MVFCFFQADAFLNQKNIINILVSLLDEYVSRFCIHYFRFRILDQGFANIFLRNQTVKNSLGFASHTHLYSIFSFSFLQPFENAKVILSL